MRFRRIGAVALVALAFGSFVVACGDDDDDTASGDGKTTATTAASGGTSDDIPTITIGATDDVAAKKFTFDVPSDLKGGAFTIELANKGKEVHDFQLVKAEEGKTLDELLKVVGSEEEPVPDWIKLGGGVGSSAPGQTGKATVDLEPGKYFYFCTESSGEDGPNAIPHATNGMSGELTLAGDTGASLPDTDATVTASEYKFDAQGLKAGENTLTFENGGKMLHHIIAIPIAEGKTIDDAKTFFTSEGEPSGPPPVDFEKGRFSSVIGPGQKQVEYWDLPAGDYAFICFMSDYGTAGPPHVAKGMITEVKVS